MNVFKCDKCKHIADRIYSIKIKEKFSKGQPYRFKPIELCRNCLDIDEFQNYLDKISKFEVVDA